MSISLVNNNNNSNQLISPLHSHPNPVKAGSSSQKQRQCPSPKVDSLELGNSPTNPAGIYTVRGKGFGGVFKDFMDKVAGGTVTPDDLQSMQSKLQQLQASSDSGQNIANQGLDPDSDDVPQKLAILPDGREALVIGDPEKLSEYNHLQGNNSLGFQQTCGLVACEDVLNQFGIEVTEDDVVKYAVANNLCYVTRDPSLSGGTTTYSQVELLRGYDIPAHVESKDSLDYLASNIQEGKAVIAEVNAGVLWDDPNAYGNGAANHAVVVTGVARDPETQKILGFFINDSGVPPLGDSGRFVDTETMKTAWSEPGGICVVTDVAYA